jgi:hypothetical protein
MAILSAGPEHGDVERQGQPQGDGGALTPTDQRADGHEQPGQGGDQQPGLRSVDADHVSSLSFSS